MFLTAGLGRAGNDLSETSHQDTIHQSLFEPCTHPVPGLPNRGDRQLIPNLTPEPTVSLEVDTVHRVCSYQKEVDLNLHDNYGVGCSDSLETTSKLATGGNAAHFITNTSPVSFDDCIHDALALRIKPDACDKQRANNCTNENNNTVNGSSRIYGQHHDITVATVSQLDSCKHNPSPASASNKITSCIIPASTTEDLRRLILSTYDTLSREVGNLLDTGQPQKKTWEHQPSGILKKVG